MKTKIGLISLKKGKVKKNTKLLGYLKNTYSDADLRILVIAKIIKPDNIKIIETIPTNIDSIISINLFVYVLILDHIKEILKPKLD